MSPLKCLIVDDEELARRLLEQYVRKLDILELVGMCKNPLEALPYLRESRIDLLFLDIQMPELTGIEFLKTLPHRPPVIITTAYPQYALEGYELDVIDYLVKPIRLERFMQAVQKAVSRVNPERQPLPGQEKEYILVKAEHKVHRLPLRDVQYIKGMQEYVAFHTTRKERILSLNSLKNLELELPSDRFIRVHKSYIVSLAAIRSLENNQLNLGEEKIPIGHTYRENVMRRVFE